MYSAVSTILHRAVRNGRKYNVLCCPTHESYETNLALTGHEFYAWRQKGVKDWRTDYRPLPSNYHLLDSTRGVNQIPQDVKFDFVLSQNKFGQFHILSKLSEQLQLPLISLEHTLPQPDWSEDILFKLRQMKGDINLFISEFSRSGWGWKDTEAEVIHHGIDTNNFIPSDKERKNHVLSVVNDWINRDGPCNFQTWKRVVHDNKIPNLVLGDTPGLSKPAESTEALIEAYQTSRIFLNTSKVSPIPTSLLEAMACGCAVVTTATCMIPDIVKDGINGFITNNEQEIYNRIQELLQNPEKAEELGNRARETVLEMFSLDKFVSNWNGIFDRAANVIYGV